jgi:hypothetical protein
MVSKRAPAHLVKVWLCIYVDMTAPFSLRLRLDYWVNRIHPRLARLTKPRPWTS